MKGKDYAEDYDYDEYDMQKERKIISSHTLRKNLIGEISYSSDEIYY